MKKKKAKIVVNNKMKGSLGASSFKKGNIPTGKIEINVKAHGGDKRELASTIKHEMLHVKHPKMTEKQVYKKSKKTSISPTEQTQLLSKMRMKKLNYKGGAIKRKFKMGRVKANAGDFISKANENKQPRVINNKKPVPKTLMGIMGLV